MAKFKIVYDRDSCIGAAACEALDPKNWKIVSDGKADLIDANEVEEGLFEKEFDEIPAELEDAVRSCPVKAIQIKKLE